MSCMVMLRRAYEILLMSTHIFVLSTENTIEYDLPALIDLTGQPYSFVPIYRPRSGTNFRLLIDFMIRLIVLRALNSD